MNATALLSRTRSLLSRSSTLPLGLHLEPRYAMVVQLGGTREQPELVERARITLPEVEHLPEAEQDRTIAEALKMGLARHRFRGSQVVCSLSSQDLFVQNVRLPVLPQEEIAAALQFEAADRLPWPVAETEIRHLLAGQIRQDTSIKQEVILLACQRSLIQRKIELLELAGLTPVAIDVEPCAVLRSLVPTKSADNSPMRFGCLNLGDRSTTVMFAEGSQILFLKSLSIGSYHMDRAVAHHLNLSLQEAAQLRGTVTASEELDANDEIHRSVIEATRDQLETLGTELELCLRYFKVTFRGKTLNSVQVTGHDANPWFAGFLGKLLSIPCEVGNPLRSISAASQSASDRAAKWATAIGLSLKKPGRNSSA